LDEEKKTTEENEYKKLSGNYAIVSYLSLVSKTAGSKSTLPKKRRKGKEK